MSKECAIYGPEEMTPEVLAILKQYIPFLVTRDQFDIYWCCGGVAFNKALAGLLEGLVYTLAPYRTGVVLTEPAMPADYLQHFSYIRNFPRLREKEPGAGASARDAWILPRCTFVLTTPGVPQSTLDQISSHNRAPENRMLWFRLEDLFPTLSK